MPNFTDSKAKKRLARRIARLTGADSLHEAMRRMNEPWLEADRRATSPLSALDPLLQESIDQISGAAQLRDFMQRQSDAIRESIADLLFGPQYDERDFYSGASGEIRRAERKIGEQQAPQSSSHCINIQLSAIHLVVYDRQLMKGFHKGYSVGRAIEILKAIPDAYNDATFHDRRFGPSIIATRVCVNRFTVGRYLKAFRRAGIISVEGVLIPDEQ